MPRELPNEKINTISTTVIAFATVVGVGSALAYYLSEIMKVAV